MKSQIILVCLFIASCSAAAINAGSAVNEEPIFTDCGGVVTLSRNGSSFISYKENVTLRSEERCIWSVIPAEEGVIFSSITLKMEVYGYESQDFTTGFIIYSWSERGIFDGKHLHGFREGDEETFQDTQLFLFFSSDLGANPTGQGFRVRVSGVASESASKTEVRQVINVPGVDASSDGCLSTVPNNVTVSFPEFPAVAYPNNAKFAVVLHRQQIKWVESNYLTVDYLDTEEGLDILEVYSVRAYHYRDETHTKLATYSGSHPEGFNYTTSYEGRIILFSSDASGSGRGFRIQWGNGL